MNTGSSLRLEKPIMECHKLLMLQVLTLWGLGGGAAPQNMDKGSTGVNIVAGKKFKDHQTRYHLARAFLFPSAKCKHCVLVSCAKILLPNGVSE